MSGIISAQVPSQAGNIFHGPSQQNGDPLQQNPYGHRNRLINYMYRKILEYLKQRRFYGIPREKIQDFVKYLNRALYEKSASEDEYINSATLESRLSTEIALFQAKIKASQASQLGNSSPSVGSVIPTLGMLHSSQSNMIIPASANSFKDPEASSSILSSSAAISGSSVPSASVSFATTCGGTFHCTEGSLSNEYHQGPNSFSTNSHENVGASVPGPTPASQMVPTLAFSSDASHPFTAVNDAGFSGADLLRMPLRQHSDGQNICVWQNLDSQTGARARSTMQPRYSAFYNGIVNNGSRNGSQMVDGSVTPGSYLSASEFGVSPRASLQQVARHHQGSLVQGAGFGLTTSDPTMPISVHSHEPAVGLVNIIQNSNRDRLQSNTIMGDGSTFQSEHPSSQLRHQLNEQSENLKFRSSQPVHEDVSHLHQQYQNRPHQFQQQPQFIPHNGLPQQSDERSQVIQSTEASIQLPLSSDARNHVAPEAKLNCQDNFFQPEVSGSPQFSEFQGQVLPSPYNSCLFGSCFPSADREISSTLSSDEIMLQPNHPAVKSQKGINGFPTGLRTDVMLLGQRDSESKDKASLAGNTSSFQGIQEVRSHRNSDHVESECRNLSTGGSISSQAVMLRTTEGPPNSEVAFSEPGNAIRALQFRQQQKLLKALLHGRYCGNAIGKCSNRYCTDVRDLWLHVKGCQDSHCSYRLCLTSKQVMDHNKTCLNPTCPVCFHPNQLRQNAARASRDSNRSVPVPLGGNCKSSNMTDTGTILLKCSQIVETTEESHFSPKRVKLERTTDSVTPAVGNLSTLLIASNELHAPMDIQPQEYLNNGMQSQEFLNNGMQINSELPEVKVEISGSSASLSTQIKMEIHVNIADDVGNEKPDGGLLISCDPAVNDKREIVRPDQDTQAKQENGTQPYVYGTGINSGKPKIRGVALTEFFTPEQVREHLTGLRQWVGQSKAKAEKNQAMVYTMDENSCQLCAAEKLPFEPPPIYCSSRCNARIKTNHMYYAIVTDLARYCFCISCYNAARGDEVIVDGTSFSKSRMQKKKNDEFIEEAWVQCDKCEAWQHQICALFNERRNGDGQAEYICPNCYIQEVESGDRKPLPQSDFLGAKDLPKTMLSNHIEQRLFRKLEQERLDRAKQQGKSYDEVPGVEGLVVRVVSSVDKRLEVKQRFREIFKEENYPVEFPYKSKVILLFQKIEGVEVFLFGMYVQEFGSECPLPNQRRVYLSYLDSVKYFRPEVRAVTGEALRTFVYHEILIGYLEYCKKRGFSSCYIWACPPASGDDYILYCHPEIQKTPRSDKLRNWYMSMLRKASKENIVVELTNLYDHFFQSIGECKAKVTAARLPNFEGDYWPGAAEEILNLLNEEGVGRNADKKGTTKKIITKRALKATGLSDLSSNASKDFVLIHKLGESFVRLKEDFIMAHLTYSCSHCCVLMVSGNRWVCRQCKNFQLCDKCYEAEQEREVMEKHPISQKEKHALFPVQITDVAEDTKDEDDILESEFFDTRQAFLNLCQAHHYQYDTLRRAKHSSMMILYHLHNPTAPAFAMTCNVCRLDVESGQGWRCETCLDFGVCNACYQKDGGINHPHRLTNRDAQSKNGRQIHTSQLRIMLDVLLHSSTCLSTSCRRPYCQNMKRLFIHSARCTVRAAGGCGVCTRIWFLLRAHAPACKDPECHVPRCNDLREHQRRLQRQSDSRRRAAVMEMVRQQAAEVNGNE